MSQLNPNAAEFVPISPTRSIPSPSACRLMGNDEVTFPGKQRFPEKSSLEIAGYFAIAKQGITIRWSCTQ